MLTSSVCLGGVGFYILRQSGYRCVLFCISGNETWPTITCLTSLHGNVTICVKYVELQIENLLFSCVRVYLPRRSHSDYRRMSAASLSVPKQSEGMAGWCWWQMGWSVWLLYRSNAPLSLPLPSSSLPSVTEQRCQKELNYLRYGSQDVMSMNLNVNRHSSVRLDFKIGAWVLSRSLSGNLSWPFSLCDSCDTRKTCKRRWNMM